MTNTPPPQNDNQVPRRLRRRAEDKQKAQKMTMAGVVARGALYVGIALLTDLAPILSSEEPIKWPATIVSLLLVALITIRSYMDQSPSQQADNVKVEPNKNES